MLFVTLTGIQNKLKKLNYPYTQGKRFLQEGGPSSTELLAKQLPVQQSLCILASDYFNSFSEF